MSKTNDFTQGDIFLPLLRFSIPLLAALVLQTAYGTVDMWMVGKFAAAADVSAVATGSQLMNTITHVITGLATGTTVLLGHTLGQGRPQDAGPIIGDSVALFSILAGVLTAATALGAGWLTNLTRAPLEAVGQTAAYIRMCGLGLCFITAYNVFGSIFRGMGDSKTPLLTVFIACVVNIIGDYLLVAVAGLGALGAAIATVAAQGVSVAVSLLVVVRRGLGFPFSPKDVGLHRDRSLRILRLGFPVALQSGLVSVSFLVVLSIANSLGVVPSAGMGIAEKLCGFLLLVPSTFSQSVTTFVAQNVGAGRLDRANRGLGQGILASLLFGTATGLLSYFFGVELAGLFNSDPVIAGAAAEFLRSYAFDCLLTAFLFPFIGYFNGHGRTGFVMLQGLIGAFGVRIPVSFLMSRLTPVSLFRVGLATPCSTLVQIVLCGGYFFWLRAKDKQADA